jgi:hypothetical protein
VTRGFRLIATSLLPIEKDTIIYGSNDGGIEVHCDVEEVNQVMEQVGKTLNICEHGTGVQGKKLYGPGDLEIHKGVRF